MTTRETWALLALGGITPVAGLWKSPNSCQSATSTSVDDDDPFQACAKGFTLSPDGAAVYVGSGGLYYGRNYGARHLYALTAADGALRWKLKMNETVSSSPVVSPDGAMVYAAGEKFSLDFATCSSIMGDSMSFHVPGNYGERHLYALTATDGALRWKFTVGEGVSNSPVVSPDSTAVYVVSAEATDPAVMSAGSVAEHTVYALEATDGTLRWKYTVSGVVSGSPKVSADSTAVYVLSDNRHAYDPVMHLHALAATDGALRWTHAMGEGKFSSPVVLGPDDTVVYAVVSSNQHTAPGRPPSNVRALAATDGALRWTHTMASGSGNSRVVSSNGYCTVVPDSPVASSDGTMVYVASEDEHLYALAAADGTVRWKFHTGKRYRIMDSFALSPDGAVVYIESRVSRTNAISWSNINALAAADGTLRWKSRRPNGDRPEGSGIVVSPDGAMLYRFPASNVDNSRGYDMVALAAVDGTSHWRYPLDGGPEKSKCDGWKMIQVSPNSTVVYEGSANGIYALSQCGTASSRTAAACSCATAGRGVGVFAAPSDQLYTPLEAHTCGDPDPTRYATGGDGAACYACPDGTFKATPGFGNCIACPKGETSVNANEREMQGSSNIGATSCFPCVNPEVCLGGGACSAGHSGPGCTTCDLGFAPFAGGCVACPAQPWVAVLPLVALLIVTAAVLFKLQKAVSAGVKRVLAKADRTSTAANKSLNLLNQAAAMMTLIAYVQGAASIAAMDLGWSYEVRWLSEILRKVAELDLIGASAPECLAGAEQGFLAQQQWRWLFSMGAPLGLMFVLGCSSVLLRSCGNATQKRLSGSAASAALGVFLVSYIFVASAAASPFDCVQGYMRDRLGVACKPTTNTAWYWDSQTPWINVGAAALSLCVLVIMVVAWSLRRAHASGALYNDEGTLRAYGSLYLRYSEECYYWEVIILVRKLLLTLVLRMMTGWAQVVCCFVLFVGSLILQRRFAPFTLGALNRLEADALAACVFLVVTGACALLGAPPTFVTAAFCVVFIGAVARMCSPLRSVWIGEGADDDTDGDGKADDACDEAELGSEMVASALEDHRHAEA